MRSKAIAGFAAGLLSIAYFGIAQPARAVQCAIYARAETGVELFGDAGNWWGQAAGRYGRGQQPSAGAILAFSPSRSTPHGHVAIVASVLGARQIKVDHANWYRGRITRGMTITDTSAGNDWTSVQVDYADGTHGRDYPTFGFIYPDESGASDRGNAVRAPQRETIETRDDRGLDRLVASTRSNGRFGRNHLQLAVADRRHPGLRARLVVSGGRHAARAGDHDRRGAGSRHAAAERSSHRGGAEHRHAAASHGAHVSAHPVSAHQVSAHKERGATKASAKSHLAKPAGAKHGRA